MYRLSEMISGVLHQLPFSCSRGLCHNDGISVIRDLAIKSENSFIRLIDGVLDRVIHRSLEYTQQRSDRDHYLFLNVLNQKRGGTQVVHGKAEEALDLLLMQVHGDDVC